MKNENEQVRAYISGKITGLSDMGRKKFEDAKNKLHFDYGTDAIIVNPHNLPSRHDKRWQSYMKVCLAALLRCNALIILPDWKKSRGAIVEVMIANIVSIPLYEINDPFVQVKINAWVKIKLGVKLFLNLL
jgi:uncharacterized protein DUF4406